MRIKEGSIKFNHKGARPEAAKLIDFIGNGSERYFYPQIAPILADFSFEKFQSAPSAKSVDYFR
jgi:hypothetical protein